MTFRVLLLSACVNEMVTRGRGFEPRMKYHLYNAISKTLKKVLTRINLTGPLNGDNVGIRWLSTLDNRTYNIKVNETSSQSTI